jgi:uncharacterized membrane protein YgcG
MTHHHRRRRISPPSFCRAAPMLLLGLALLLSPAFSSAARAVEPKVRDNAKFFSDDAWKKALARIEQIHEKFGKDLAIDTLPIIPEPQQTPYANVKDDPEKRVAFFDDWARQRERELNVDGVYVMIIKQPPHLQVVFAKNTQREGMFTQANADQLRDILVGEFKEQRYDDALGKAVDYVQRSFEENKRKPAAERGASGAAGTSSSSWGGGVPGGLMHAGNTAAPSSGFSLGGLLCMGIAILFV